MNRVALSFMAAASLWAGESNLIPNPEFRASGGSTPDGWAVWAPRPALADDAASVGTVSGRALRLESRGYHSFGKWIARATGVTPGRTYRFEVLYLPEGLDNEQMTVNAMLSWCKDAQCRESAQRDYVDRGAPSPTGWRKLARDFVAPAGTVAVNVELGLRLAPRGAVLWQQPRLTEVAPRQHRTPRIVTTRVRKYGTTYEENIALVGDVLDRAAKEKPDLVLLTETFTDVGRSVTVTESAQPIPGPTTKVLSEKAQKLHSWVAMSLLEREGEKVFNTAVLIDREGRIAGKYRKVHLPIEEAERGVTPGRGYSVVQTDFGSVGMLICWDHSFTESARMLRLAGAEVVLVPIAGDTPQHWDVISRARAIDNGLYMVSSIGGGDEPSRIVAPTGDVLAETKDGLAAATVDLDKETRVYWLSVGPADGEPHSLYLKERRPDTYGSLATAAPPQE